MGRHFRVHVVCILESDVCRHDASSRSVHRREILLVNQWAVQLSVLDVYLLHPRWQTLRIGVACNSNVLSVDDMCSLFYLF